MQVKTLSLDFEFNTSSEKTMNVVCAVTKYNGISKKYDLRTPEKVQVFKSKMDALLGEEDTYILCYFGSAETRGLLSCGYTPVELLNAKWLDIYVLWSMLTHSHPDFRYGRIWDKKTSKWIVTIKPPFGESDEDEWEDDEIVSFGASKYRPTGKGLADVVAHQLGVVIDTDHKDAMRDLILGKNTWTDEEFTQIIDYCAMDVEYLLAVFKLLITSYNNITGLGVNEIVELSRYSVSMGIVEANGIPIDIRKMEQLSANFLKVDREIVDACNEVYPFYNLVKPIKADREKGWGDLKPQETDLAWKTFLEEANMLADWPKSVKTGKPQRTKEVMEDYEGHVAVNAYSTARKARKQLQYFSPWAFDRIAKNIGSDGCIRTLLGPYKTKTGRNAPSVANGYVFAMSSWLRPLISAPKGKVILGADFSAQEIVLQGWVSGDTAYIDAYESGDPYTWLAQTAGIMDPTVFRNTDGKFQYIGSDVVIGGQMAEDLKNQRNLTKALLLGIGFGMGFEKLGKQLSAAKLRGLNKEQKAIVRAAFLPTTPQETKDEGLRIIDECTVYASSKDAPPGTDKDSLATTYKGLHQNIFKDYWKWRTEVIKDYETDGFLALKDGWCLFTGEDRPNTVANFKVQGLGASILRKAIELCIRAGLHVISPLHDAIYIMCDEADKEAQGAILIKCMKQAVHELTGNIDLIRIDWEEYITDWENMKSTWTKDKGGYEFERFGKYMKADGYTDLSKVPTPEFDEPSHKYRFRGKQMKGSVSGVIERIKKPFDAMYWSKKKSNGDDVQAASLRQQWQDKADFACLKGTISHLILEAGIQKDFMGITMLPGHTQDLITPYANDFHFEQSKAAAKLTIPTLYKEAKEYLTTNGYEVVSTEQRMVWPELMLAGTADLICKRNGKYCVMDWKTNEDLDKPSYGNFLGAMSHIPASKINGYAIQMSLYRVILEKRWGVGPWEDVHVILWGSEGSARIIEVAHIPEVEQLLTL